MHQPANGLEQRLLQAIGRSGPAPQGIAVLNSDGQVLDWVLMFDDDPSVLKFLDHTLQRFGQHPDSAQPFTTERYQRFPTAKREGQPAHEARLPARAKHPPDDHCPADSRYAANTLVTKVIGRRLDDDGKLNPGVINQEDYSQDRFVIPPDLQRQLALALDAADPNRIKVPSSLAQLWVGYAYLGMLDVRPLNNPAGVRTDRESIEFWAQADSGQAGWHRVTGTSHVSVRKERRQGDGAGFENDIQLNWQGWMRLEKGHITSLRLIAEGQERLKWSNGQPPGTLSRGPEVASLPGGRPVDWKGPVRFGLLGEPVAPANVRESSTAERSPAEAMYAVRTKMQELQGLVQRRQAAGGDMRPVGEQLNTFQNLMKEQQFTEAEKVLDAVLKLLSDK